MGVLHKDYSSNMQQNLALLPLPGSITRREPSPSPSSKSSLLLLSLQELPQLEQEFTLIRTLSEGCFSKVLLVRTKGGMKERLALKAIHAEATSAEEFGREMNTNYFLSPHPHISTSYNVAFIWDNCFVYAQEYAGWGDLSGHLRREGIAEDKVKGMAGQIAGALEFIASYGLVHRDLRAENVLVHRKDLSLVKLGDFGHALPASTTITKSRAEFTAATVFGAAAPPEVAEIVVQERYSCSPAEDVWTLGILLIQCLVGESPWSSADICDPGYSTWVDWLKRKSLRVPEPFSHFSPRFLRLCKRLLEPKPSKRSKVSEVHKYLGDEWCGKGFLLRRSSTAAAIDRHESNATSGGGGGRRAAQVYGAGGKKRSTRSLKLDNELEAELGVGGQPEPVGERVGRWVFQTSINTTS